MSDYSGPVEVERDIIADTSCPECRAGKHPNCNGDSWDNMTDRPGACPCWARDHRTPVLRTVEEEMADLAGDRYERGLAGEL